MTGIQFPTGAGKGFFSLRHRVQTSSEAHPASYSVGTEALSPWVRRPGRVVNLHSPVRPHGVVLS